jgi:hypothetical protein
VVAGAAVAVSAVAARSARNGVVATCAASCGEQRYSIGCPAGKTPVCQCGQRPYASCRVVKN